MPRYDVEVQDHHHHNQHHPKTIQLFTPFLFFPLMHFIEIIYMPYFLVNLMKPFLNVHNLRNFNDILFLLLL